MSINIERMVIRYKCPTAGDVEVADNNIDITGCGCDINCTHYLIEARCPCGKTHKVEKNYHYDEPEEPPSYPY